MIRRPRWLTVIGLLGVVAMGFTVWLGLWITPPDQFQGNLARLLYIHPAIATVALYWVGLVAAGGSWVVSLVTSVTAGGLGATTGLTAGAVVAAGAEEVARGTATVFLGCAGGRWRRGRVAAAVRATEGAPRQPQSGARDVVALSSMGNHLAHCSDAMRHRSHNVEREIRNLVDHEAKLTLVDNR